MKARAISLSVLAAGILMSATALRAEDQVAPQIRVETKIDADNPAQPQVRMFINGKEVSPGASIQFGEGGSIKLDARVDTRDGDEAKKPPRNSRAPGEAFLGLMLVPTGMEGAGRKGARVMDVTPESPAAEAGIKADDVITAINGEAVAGPRELAEEIRGHKPGDSVKLSLSRNGLPIEKTVTLAARPEVAPSEPGARERREGPSPRNAAPQERRSAEAFLGVMAAPLTDEIREITGAQHGVLVNSLLDSSPAAAAGLMAGDVIVAIDGREVGSPEQLVDRIRAHKPGDEVRITYYRMGKRREAAVRLGELPSPGERPEGRRLFNVPEGLNRDMPELKQYLDNLSRELEELVRPDQPGREPTPNVRPEPNVRPQPNVRPEPNARPQPNVRPEPNVRPQLGQPLPPGAMLPPGATVPPGANVAPGQPLPPGMTPNEPRMMPFGPQGTFQGLHEQLDRIERRLDSIEHRLDRMEREK